MGLAALQVAKATACHVVATAGNPEKRAAVRARGASCVAGSRDTRFVDVLACQAGQTGPGQYARLCRNASLLPQLMLSNRACCHAYACGVKLISQIPKLAKGYFGYSLWQLGLSFGAGATNMACGGVALEPLV